MKVVNKDKVNWQVIKLQDFGANGLFIHYGFLYGPSNEYHRDYKCKNDAEVDKDLSIAFRKLNSIVTKVESLDYARKLLELPGYEPTSEQQKLTEQTVQQQLQKITVTGITLISKKQGDGVIISYNKANEQDEITGHVTTWICYNGDDVKYGIEEDLEELIEEIKSETYEYEFNDKFAERAQQIIPYPDEDEDENNDTGIKDAELAESE